jgi:hypothetical protein
MSDPDLQANARLVWKPGQEHLRAIHPAVSDGSRRTGGFVAFVPASENGGQVCEDGFEVLLSLAAWLKVRGALLSGQSVFLPADGDGAAFTLEWNEQVYFNPIDGMRLEPEGGWQRYGPPAVRVAASTDEPAFWQGTMLLTSDEDMGQRLRRLEDLSEFMGVLDRTLRDFFTALPSGPGEDLLLDCQLLPGGKAEYHLALRPGNLDQENLRGLYERLAELRACPVQHGPVHFQMFFALWGGSGKPSLFTAKE